MHTVNILPKHILWPRFEKHLGNVYAFDRNQIYIGGAIINRLCQLEGPKTIPQIMQHLANCAAEKRRKVPDNHSLAFKIQDPIFIDMYHATDEQFQKASSRLLALWSRYSRATEAIFNGRQADLRELDREYALIYQELRTSPSTELPYNPARAPPRPELP